MNERKENKDMIGHDLVSGLFEMDFEHDCDKNATDLNAVDYVYCMLCEHSASFNAFVLVKLVQ